jgi:hypothetical protein
MLTSEILPRIENPRSGSAQVGIEEAQVGIEAVLHFSTTISTQLQRRSALLPFSTSKNCHSRRHGKELWRTAERAAVRPK